MNEVKDDCVWFMDGNIIILAGPAAKVPGCERQDGRVYAFRCHKAVMARHSEVFRQLFEMPGSDEDEMLDEVPTVTLPDKWEDVRDLLRLLYGYFELPRKQRDPNTLNVLAGPLQLAKKYMMDDVWNTLVKVLEEDWPIQLKDWYAAEDATAAAVERASDIENKIVGTNKWYNWNINDHIPDPVATINLARELDIPSILPSTFYDLNRVYFALDPYPLAETFGRIEMRRAETARLSQTDMSRLTKGRELMRARMTYLLRELADDFQYRPMIAAIALPHLRSVCRLAAEATEPVSPGMLGAGDSATAPLWPCSPRAGAWARQEVAALFQNVVFEGCTQSIFVGPFTHLRRLQKSSLRLPRQRTTSRGCAYHAKSILRGTCKRRRSNCGRTFQSFLRSRSNVMDSDYLSFESKCHSLRDRTCYSF